MKIISLTDEIINNQINTSDDSIETVHVLYKQGTYNQRILLYGDEGIDTIESYVGRGDGKGTLREIIRVRTDFIMSKY